MIGPDEKIFDEHLKSAEYFIAVEDGKWAMVDSDFEWPKRLFWIKSTLPKYLNDRVYFLFDLANYPSAAPSAVPWDIEINIKLGINRWPSGNDRVEKAFKPNWDGGNSLYIPCDRSTMKDHPNWQQQYPQDRWTSDKTIVHYLRIVYELLN